jgi:hypothetical protein
MLISTENECDTENENDAENERDTGHPPCESMGEHAVGEAVVGAAPRDDSVGGRVLHRVGRLGQERRGPTSCSPSISGCFSKSTSFTIPAAAAAAAKGGILAMVLDDEVLPPGGP